MGEETHTYLVGIASDKGVGGNGPRVEPFPVVHGLYVVDAVDADEAARFVQADGVRQLEPGMSLVTAKATEFVVRQSVERI